jgi:hypothetical protein
VACLIGYHATRGCVLIAAGVVGVAIAVPEAVHNWTGGALGADASLPIAGLSLLAASVAALRLRRRADRSPAVGGRPAVAGLTVMVGYAG